MWAMDKLFVYLNHSRQIDSDRVESDKLIEDDERTMRIIQKITNSIDPSIQITFDVPSNHENNMVLILDVQANVNENGKISYVLFQKPMQNRLKVMKNSAMPTQQKMQILTQECYRRIHNTSEDIPDEVKTRVLERFMEDLKLSGYDEHDRLRILKGGFNTFKNIKEKEQKGLRPFYRSNLFNKEARKDAKKMKKKTWFKGRNENHQVVMFVEALAPLSVYFFF